MKEMKTTYFREYIITIKKVVIKRTIYRFRKTAKGVIGFEILVQVRELSDETNNLFKVTANRDLSKPNKKQFV